MSTSAKAIKHGKRLRKLRKFLAERVADNGEYFEIAAHVAHVEDALDTIYLNAKRKEEAEAAAGIPCDCGFCGGTVR